MAEQAEWDQEMARDRMDRMDRMDQMEADAYEEDYMFPTYRRLVYCNMLMTKDIYSLSAHQRRYHLKEKEIAAGMKQRTVEEHQIS
jgi:hypothetical protein